MTGCLLPGGLNTSTRHYLLNPVIQPDEGETAKAGSQSPRWVLGLEPIVIPAYLQKPTLAVRLYEQGNEVEYAESHRWAEDLEQGIQRVIRANLEGFPEVQSVFQRPFPLEAQPSYRLHIRVLACEGVRYPDGTGAALFQAQWVLIPGEADPEEMRTRTFNPEPLSWAGQDYRQLAEQLSEIIGEMAAEIVATLPEEPPES